MASEVCEHKWENITIQRPVGGYYWEICFKCSQTRKIRLRGKRKYAEERKRIKEKYENEQT